MRIKLLAGGLLLTLATPAFAENWDFVLVNKTGKTIKLVELAEAGSGAWAKDKRDEDVSTGKIKPGEDYTVHFEKLGEACKFDVRMTFDDDSQAVWAGFDVCKYAFGDFSLNGDLPVVKGT
ncbi:MAG: hypothetical protein ACEQR8_02325 [Cypionkella sp.]